MQIVILGCGYLAYNIYNHFKDKCHCTVYGYKSSFSYLVENFIETDIFKLDENTFKDAIVIDCISLINNTETDENKLIFVKNKYEAFLKKLKLSYLYINFSSGGTIYGDSEKLLNENDPINPQSIYAKSKALIENLIVASGIDYLILRLSNPYGGHIQRERNQGVIPIIIRSILLNKEFKLRNDLSSTRDYLHMDDLLIFLQKLIENNLKNQIINLSYGKSFSLNQIINFCEKYCEAKLNYNTEINFDYQMHSRIDNLKLIKLTDYFPKIDLAQGILKEVKRIKKELEPSFSILIPVYNISTYLKKCLDSILAQDYHNYEVIMVDDGSTDESGAICKNYDDNYANFHYYYKENKGLADTRNYGIQKAKNDYIIFIDGDDYIASNYLSSVKEVINMYNADLIIFDFIQEYTDNSKEYIKIDLKTDAQIDPLKDNLLIKAKNCVWNKVYHRRLLKNCIYGPWRYYEDLSETYNIILEASNIHYLNKALYYYLVNRSGNITTSFNDNVYDIFLSLNKLINYYKERKVYEKFYDQIEHLSLINIMECLKKLRNVELLKAFKFINTSFKFINENFPNYRSAKISPYIQKNDKLYLNKYKLMIYLVLRKIIRRNNA